MNTKTTYRVTYELTRPFTMTFNTANDDIINPGYILHSYKTSDPNRLPVAGVKRPYGFYGGSVPVDSYVVKINKTVWKVEKEENWTMY